MPDLRVTLTKEQLRSALAIAPLCECGHPMTTEDRWGGQGTHPETILTCTGSGEMNPATREQWVAASIADHAIAVLVAAEEEDLGRAEREAEQARMYAEAMERKRANA